VDKVKKLMEGLPIATSCVRLSDVVPLIGIAEGIETAFAASVIFGFPVWASTSAFGMEKWEPPQGVEEVVICADNDISFTGQAAAFQLAKRLNLKGVKARVEIPPMSGVDWCDLRSAEPAATPIPAQQLTV
jgi:putative DNA primase/helicase